MPKLFSRLSLVACAATLLMSVAPAMAQAVLQLAADPGLRQAMGAAARIYAETHLDQAAVLTRFAGHLHALVQGKPLQPSLVTDDRALGDERV